MRSFTEEQILNETYRLTEISAIIGTTHSFVLDAIRNRPRKYAESAAPYCVLDHRREGPGHAYDYTFGDLVRIKLLNVFYTGGIIKRHARVIFASCFPLNKAYFSKHYIHRAELSEDMILEFRLGRVINDVLLGAHKALIAR